jgi:hypothetical protein
MIKQFRAFHFIDVLGAAASTLTQGNLVIIHVVAEEFALVWRHLGKDAILYFPIIESTPYCVLTFFLGRGFAILGAIFGVEVQLVLDLILRLSLLSHIRLQLHFSLELLFYLLNKFHCLPFGKFFVDVAFHFFFLFLGHLVHLEILRHRMIDLFGLVEILVNLLFSC